MNWNTPMLFFRTSQSYLPAETQNRTDTMMKPSCCTGEDGGVEADDHHVVKSVPVRSRAYQKQEQGCGSTILCMVFIEVHMRWWASSMTRKFKIGKVQCSYFCIDSPAAGCKHRQAKEADLDAVAAPVDVVDEPRGEVVADQGDAGVEQRPRQGGGDAAAYGAQTDTSYARLRSNTI